MARRYMIAALLFALAGLTLGIYMAASQNHQQLVTHAHILLVGFVVSFIYATCYRLWELDDSTRLVQIQFIAHLAGAIVLSVALFLLYGQFLPLSVLDPILAVASLAVLAGMIIMTVHFIRSTAKSPTQA